MKAIFDWLIAKSLTGTQWNVTMALLGQLLEKKTTAVAMSFNDLALQSGLKRRLVIRILDELVARRVVACKTPGVRGDTSRKNTWTLRYENIASVSQATTPSVLQTTTPSDGKTPKNGANSPHTPHIDIKRVFIRPKAEEVTAYASTLGFRLDGNQFCDFYESKGWLIGKVPMKDWKAAVRTWRRNNYGGTNGTHERPSIFGLSDPQIRQKLYSRRDSELRKVSSAGEILDGLGNLHLSQPPGEKK